MDTIKTATGKSFSCDFFAEMPVPARLYIRVQDVTITDVAAVFSDKSETEKLTYGGSDVDGYTSLHAIIPEGNSIQIVLGKE